MRAAAIQMNSTIDRERNLACAEELIRAARSDGAELIVLPEHFDLRGSDRVYAGSSEPLEGQTVVRMCELAESLRVDLIAGSFAERRPDRDKPSNTSVHIGPDGRVHGRVSQDPPLRRHRRSDGVPRVGGL